MAQIELANGQNGLGHLNLIHKEHGICEDNYTFHQRPRKKEPAGIDVTGNASPLGQSHPSVPTRPLIC